LVAAMGNSALSNIPKKDKLMTSGELIEYYTKIFSDTCQPNNKLNKIISPRELSYLVVEIAFEHFNIDFQTGKISLETVMNYTEQEDDEITISDSELSLSDEEDGWEDEKTISDSELSSFDDSEEYNYDISI
jgi:hypothetical protein